MSALERWDGRTVLVTGGGMGLGRAIALDFAARGACVYCADIVADGLAETATLAANPVKTMIVDVRNRASVDEFVQAAIADTGQVDLLVNGAGGICGQSGLPIEDVIDDDWNHILAVNATGAFSCARAVVPAMKRAGRGRIVTLSSSAGLTRTVTGIQAYAVAKAGVIGMTRQLAHELGPFGITVNSVAPSFIPCNAYALGKLRDLGEAGRAAAVQAIAMRRFGRVEDVVHAVAFFASDRSGWITGQTLSVDGGA